MLCSVIISVVRECNSSSVLNLLFAINSIKLSF